MIYNNTGGQKNKMDIGKKSIAERIMRLEITVENAKMPEIMEAIAKYGYDENFIKIGENHLENLRKIEDSFIDTTRYYNRTTDAFENEKKRLKKIYSTHATFCRFLFRDSPPLIEKLQLKGKQPTQFVVWLENAKQLYKNALSDPEILKPLKTRNITREELKKCAADLEKLEITNRQKNLHREERRVLMAKRNEELKKAEEWRKELILFARQGLGENKQILGAIQVFVRS